MAKLRQPMNRDARYQGVDISNDEGHRWFKETYNHELPTHYRQDMNVPIRLEKLLEERNQNQFKLCRTTLPTPDHDVCTPEKSDRGLCRASWESDTTKRQDHIASID